MLQRNTLEESTLVLLKDLCKLSIFKDLRLVGGTALALQLGHRHSIDLDLFGVIAEDLDIAKIENILQTAGFEVLVYHNSKAIKTIFVNNVKVDIVSNHMNWFNPPIEIEGIRMAGLKDIAAMKLFAITGRGRKKDFVDLYFLLQHFTLEQMLSFFEEKYPNTSLFLVEKSLTYFHDAEQDPMPEMSIDVSWNKIKSTICDMVKNL